MSEREINDRLADPALLTDLLAEIAQGGTLAAFARAQSIPYRLLNRWLQDDEARAKRYKLALDIREDHAKDLIIAELTSYMRANVTEAFDGDGNLLKLADMPEDVRRLIAGVEFTELFEMQGQGKERQRVHIGRIHKIKFWDKPRSVETYMKHLAMLVDRKAISGTLSLADLVTEEQGRPH